MTGINECGDVFYEMSCEGRETVEDVKENANKMYAKVDVRSRQELVELVDKKMSEFEVASDTLPRTIL